MALQGWRANVGTSATRVDVDDTAIDKSILVRNRGAVPIFVGGVTVSAAMGYQIDPGERIFLDITRTGAGGVWACTASGTCTVHVLQMGA